MAVVSEGQAAVVITLWDDEFKWLRIWEGVVVLLDELGLKFWYRRVG